MCKRCKISVASAMIYRLLVIGDRLAILRSNRRNDSNMDRRHTEPPQRFGPKLTETSAAFDPANNNGTNERGGDRKRGRTSVHQVTLEPLRRFTFGGSSPAAIVF